MSDRKLTIVLNRRGRPPVEFANVEGFRFLPGWVSLIDEDGVERLFATGDGEGCIVDFNITPLEAPQIVTPGGLGLVH